MLLVIVILKIIIALGLLNVWVLRFNKISKWRGGESKNMQEEFKAYGLPLWLMYLVGSLKVISALLLIISIEFPINDTLILYLICFMMLGAVFMHIRIRDSYMKSIPAFLLLVITLILIFI